MEHAFIVIETKRGNMIPARVWTATGKVDYISKVQASCPRSGAVFEDFEQVMADDAERCDMSVQIMRKAEFMQYDTESLDKRIVEAAVRLGWIEETENE